MAILRIIFVVRLCRILSRFISRYKLFPILGVFRVVYDFVYRFTFALLKSDVFHVVI